MGVIEENEGKLPDLDRERKNTHEGEKASILWMFVVEPFLLVESPQSIRFLNLTRQSS